MQGALAERGAKAWICQWTTSLSSRQAQFVDTPDDGEQAEDMIRAEPVAFQSPSGNFDR